jgi:hypothetical protein
MNRRVLQYLSIALAVVVALLHLFHPDIGIFAFMTYLSIQSLPDPRPLAFVLSAIAILLGIALVADGVLPARPAYLGGMALMITYIGGYFVWHMFGHGAWWPWGTGLGGHSHTFLEILIGDQHLRDDMLALVSKIAELALLVVLGALYVEESG